MVKISKRLKICLNFLNKKNKKYLKKLIKIKKYNNYLFEYFSKYLELHPLDFNILSYNYLFKKDLDFKNNWLISLTQEELITNKWFIFKKRYFWYTFEWFIVFSSLESKIKKDFKNLNINSWNDRFSFYYDKWIMENLLINDFPNLKKILTNTFLKEEFYNKIYIAWYHQEQTQLPLINRLLYFIIIFWKSYYKNSKKIKKFLLILIWIMFKANNFSKSKNLFNINNVLEWLVEFKIKKKEVLEFLNFIWLEKYDNYVNKVKNNWLKYYFPKENIFNFINIELEIHKTPFIDIGKYTKWYYLFDETYLLRKFYTNTQKYIYDKDNKVKKFWDLIEKYIKDFINKWLKYEKSKLDNIYKIWQWIKFWKAWKKWEIDLFIFNKKTKNLIIFEAKDRKRLNIDLFRVDLISDLTSIKNRISNWKMRKNVKWDIYEWIEQLYKHSKKNKKEISKVLWINKINNIEYIFLTHHNTMFWNEIMRYFIDKNKEFEWLNYNFMNLFEFEKLISLWCKKGIDFFELIKWKTEKFNKIKSYNILLERFRSYENINRKLIKISNPKQLNQDFNIYFDKIYWYNSTDISPFINIEWIFNNK